MVQIERPNYDREGRDNVEKTFANALTLVSLSQQLVIKQSFVPASSNIFPSMPDVVIPTPLGACDNEFQDILGCLLGFRRSHELFLTCSPIPICRFQFPIATATQYQTALKVLLLVITGTIFWTSTSKFFIFSASDICRCSRSLT